MIRRRAVVAGVFVLAIAHTAHAQDDAPKIDNRARAQQLFDSALADAEKGDFASACPKFQASQEADPKTSTLLNLANCYEKNGQTASAWGAFREAETLARKASRTDWETAARTRADALEPKLVRLTITVPDATRVSGLVVTRDGAKLGAGEWGVAIPVDPGDHLVAASAEGYKSWEEHVVVKETSGAISVPPLAQIPVVPPPPQGQALNWPPPPPMTTPHSWWTPLRTAGVVTASVGGVAMATGVILGFVAKGSYDDARSQCANGTHACPTSAVSDANGAYGLAAGATVVFVIGAVAALTGGALILIAPSPDATGMHVGPGSIAGRF
jgi:hypothetical protein